MKRTALVRRTPLRPRRSTPRTHKTTTRLKGAEMKKLRMACWMRDLCSCVDCGVSTLWTPRFDGDPQAYDMAHVRSRGAGGSDSLDNVTTLCHRCHMRQHTEGK